MSLALFFLSNSGLVMIFTGKGVATIILALFVANAFLYITIYLFSKVIRQYIFLLSLSLSLSSSCIIKNHGQ